MAAANILVVDDDFDIRDTLADVLADEGYTVATAAHGLEALAYLRSHAAPCLIVLDLMMPRCDGAQFRAEQLRDPAIAGIPVVLLTADARRDEKKALLKTDSCLGKPVDLNQLFETIRQYCPR